MEEFENTQLVELNEDVICIFKPHEDTAFTCHSHEAIAVVRTPQGDFIFSREVQQ